jgi:hypothetical protein
LEECDYELLEWFNQQKQISQRKSHFVARLLLKASRKEEGLQEARRAMETRPIAADALNGTTIATNAASVYAWANQPDFAFEQLNILIKMPGLFINYGDLKTNPNWDPLRKDPRFDKLLAELAPRD